MSPRLRNNETDNSRYEEDVDEHEQKMMNQNINKKWTRIPVAIRANAIETAKNNAGNCEYKCQW